MDKPHHPHKFSDFFYNRLSYTGALLAFIIFFIELLLFGLDFFGGGHSVYLGIITYTILPPFLILGLILIPIGALRRRRQVLKGLKTARRMPIYINFSNPKHRNAFIVFIVGTTILIIMSVIGSYQAYHYTESVHFCGITCHDVMEPQYVRYLQSPHARVKCIDCHVGSGVSNYVSAKMNGVNQLFSLAKKTYPRPITGPVRNLRPAEEICGQCHWPYRAVGTVERNRHYFLTDDEGPQRWFIRMLFRVGDRDVKGKGRHNHMFLNDDIYFVANDERKQEITWVKSVDERGVETVFTSPDSPYKDNDPPQELVKKMDCIDCHNRPAHQFVDPSRLINQAIAGGTLDEDLPGIKEHAMALLAAEYTDKKEALRKIKNGFIDHYKKSLAGGYAEKKRIVEFNAERLKGIYKDHFFPEMRARWDAYPSNIGHLISPGCFRCHDGEHESEGGRIIPHDCITCHSIIEQGPPDNLEKSLDGLEFRHPTDIGGVWEYMSCIECHTGY